MGFQNFSSGMFVRELKEVVYCSTLEGLFPSLSRVVHYVHVIVIVMMSLFLKDYLIPLVKWTGISKFRYGQFVMESD